jgi:phage-related minor tail protein
VKFRLRRKLREAERPNATEEQSLEQLAAKADVITEELDKVVKQISDLIRKKAQ